MKNEDLITLLRTLPNDAEVKVEFRPDDEEEWQGTEVNEIGGELLTIGDRGSVYMNDATTIVIVGDLEFN
jgi:hypothetical protein